MSCSYIVNFNPYESSYLIVGLTRFYVLNEIDIEKFESMEYISTEDDKKYRMLKLCNRGNINLMNKLIEDINNFNQDEINVIIETLDSIKNYFRDVYKSDIDSCIRSKIKSIIR